MNDVVVTTAEASPSKQIELAQRFLRQSVVLGEGFGVIGPERAAELLELVKDDDVVRRLLEVDEDDPE